MNLWGQMIFVLYSQIQCAACIWERQTIVKIMPHYWWISKIPSRGWRAWKIWFLTIASSIWPFIDLWHLENWPKNHRSQKNFRFQKLVFSCLFIMRTNFWNSFTVVIVFNISQIQAAHCIWEFNTKIIWPHKFIWTCST